jgi:hypothetical protein
MNRAFRRLEVHIEFAVAPAEDRNRRETALSAPLASRMLTVHVVVGTGGIR